MSLVIKIAKQGVNVLHPDNAQQPKKKNRTTPPHLLYAIAFSYLQGAKKQVVRYQSVIKSSKGNPVLQSYDCLHESSALFEDLSAIGKYIEKCGVTNKLHQKWFDIRNHIRHDIREEFDNEKSSRKSERAKKLKLDSRYQTDITFNINSIKIGKTTVKMSEINAYLDWADKVISQVIDDAKKKGYIK